MQQPEPEETRVETIAAAAIYLMTHPDAPPVLRDCAALHGSWTEAAQAGSVPPGPLH